MAPSWGPTFSGQATSTRVWSSALSIPPEQNSTDDFAEAVFSAWIIFPKLQGICVCHSISLLHHEFSTPNREIVQLQNLNKSA